MAEQRTEERVTRLEAMYEHVATKADLQVFKADLQQEIGGVKIDLQQEIGDVKIDFHKEIGDVRVDLAALRGEVRSLRWTMGLGFTALAILVALVGILG